VALVGVIVVGLWMPGRSTEAAPVTAGEPEKKEAAVA
jgi:hypothetical protein